MRDTGAYYGVSLDRIYEHSTFMSAGYVYSPAFALLTEPFRWFPIEVMEGTVRVASALALGYLITPWAGFGLLLVDVPGLRAELAVGNIDLVIAAVVVWVLWRPWLWPALLLTKVSPGVGLGWHIARREWHALGIAMAATIVVVLLALPFTLRAWPEWFSTLTGSNIAIAEAHTGLPLLPRLGLGLAIAYVAGYFSAPWLVPIAIAVSFANPNPAHALVILAAVRLALKPHTRQSTGITGRERPANI
jgi:hypothetical protein